MSDSTPVKNRLIPAGAQMMTHHLSNSPGIHWFLQVVPAVSVEKTISVTGVDHQDDEFHLFGEDDDRDMIHTVSPSVLCSALGVSTDANILAFLSMQLSAVVNRENIISIR